MRHTILIPAFAAFVTLAAVLTAAQNGSAADKPATSNNRLAMPALKMNPYIPSIVSPCIVSAQPRPTAALDKAKALGERLGQALNRAVDVLSGNEAELLSRNRAALLSGNEAEFLAKNKTALLSGNSPRTKAFNGENSRSFSDNKTAVLSGNKAEGNTFNLFSNIHLFSDIRVDVHTNNSGTDCGNANLNTGEKEKAAPSTSTAHAPTAATLAPSYTFTPAISTPAPTYYSMPPNAAPSGNTIPRPTPVPGGYPQTSTPYVPSPRPSYVPDGISPYAPTPARNQQSEIETLRRENEQLKNSLNAMGEQYRRTKEQLQRLRRENANPSVTPPPSAATPST